MARLYNGSDSYSDVAAAFLSASPGPFTIALWLKPDNLTQVANWLVSSGSLIGNAWGLRWEAVANSVSFYAGGYTGTDPSTGSAIALTSAHVANGAWLAYRYLGAAAEWSKWLAGTKTVINASITFSFGALAAATYVGAGGTDYFAGAIAEIAIWDTALADEDLILLAQGVSAKQFGGAALKVYWPLRGNSSPEPDYTATTWGGGNPLTVRTETKTTHPRTVVGPRQATHHSAWVLDLYHTSGQIRAGSVDLDQDIDTDVLGGFYRRRIKNADSLTVEKQLPDAFHGVAPPSSVTLLLDNTDLKGTIPTAIDGLVCWLKADAITGLSDGNAVSSWLDSSGRGFAAVQSTGSKQPTYKTAIQNSLPVVRFDGTSDCLTIASVPLDTYFTMFVVAKCTNAKPMFIEHGADVNLNPGFFLYGTSASMIAINRDAGLHYAPGAANWMGATWTIVSAVYDGAHRVFRAGVIQDNGVVVGTARARSTVTTTLNLFARNNGASLLSDGDLAELIVFNGALSLDVIRQLEAYLSRKWSITVTPTPQGIDPALEWRGVRAALRRYDRVGHALATELTGTVQDLAPASNRVAITIESQKIEALNTLIPQVILNPDLTPSANDLGAPVPVVLGAGGWFSPPHGGLDETDPGGDDFIISHLLDADNAVMPVRVEQVYEDDGQSASIETRTDWQSAPGSPTYLSTTTFTVTGDQTYWYEVATHGGRPLRCKTTASTPNYIYTHVTGYSAGTVTVAEAVLDGGLTAVEITTEYLVERGRFINGAFDELVSLRRFLGGGEGSLVVYATNTNLQNPGAAVREMLRNPYWALSESVNAASFDTGQTDFTDAGLGSAIAAVLAGDRQQHQAIDVFDAILVMRGARISYDGDNSEWRLTVDTAPTAARVILELGEGTANTIRQIRSRRRTPLANAIKTLKLRYALQPRLLTNADQETAELSAASYQYEASISVLTVGQVRVLSSPWIRSHAAAKAFLAYLGKRLRYADELIELDVGLVSWRVQEGDLVRVISAVDALDDTYRVRRVQQQLAGASLELEGYDAAIFDNVTTAVIVATNTADPDVRRSIPGTGANLWINSDLAIPPRSATIGQTILPGFALTNPSSVSALTITTESKAMGGRYLGLAVSSVSPAPNLLQSNITSSTLPFGVAVLAGQLWVPSVYCDRTDWYWQIIWALSGGGTSTSTLKMRIDTTAQNGLGWKRYYGVARAPATAVYAQARFVPQTAATYQFDAFQFEQASRRSGRPTHWKRHATWGIDPAQIATGTVQARRTDDPENASQLTFASATVATTSGTTVTATGLIPAGAFCVGVTLRVLTTVTGPASMQCGDGTTADLWGTAIALAAGTRTSDADFKSTWNPTYYKTAQDVVLTAVGGGGSFTAGSVRLVAHCVRLVGPAL